MSLFSNSTEYSCWLHANCDQCQKYDGVSDNGNLECEIQDAIELSALGEEMSPEMIQRMGGVELEKYPGEYDFFSQQCTEFLQKSKAISL